MITWKPDTRIAINRMTVDEASQWIIAYSLRPITIDQPAIRELTGGYASQSINQIVKFAVYQRSKGRHITKSIMME
jgi:hypothetical protein